MGIREFENQHYTEFNLSNSEETDFITKESFATFIKEKRKAESNQKGKEGISTKELAMRVGIGYEMFRKIINKQKPNQSRDCVIAISAALAMDEEDTNMALVLYKFMPKLDEKNPRDASIIRVLQGNLEEKISVEAVNNALQSSGYSPLEVIDHRDKDGKKIRNEPQKSFPYSVIKKGVKTVTTDLLYDRYDSLETAYSFYRYKCIATMWLKNSANQKTYKLTADPKGSYLLENLSYSEEPIKPFKTIDETGEFINYYLELHEMARSEQHRMESYLNDTRNYYERIGAGIHSNSIHVYIEKYNYTIPERNEYYLFEYINGVYRLSVSHKSIFMQKYLTEEEFKEHYGKASLSTFEIYDSFEEIERLSKEPKLSEESKFILKLRTNAFSKMKQVIDNYLKQLRNRQIFVRNLEHIYDDRDQVCVFYGLANEFKCELNEFGDFKTAGVESANIVTEDGQSVTLEISDLHRAFELGFKSVDEICRVKLSKGSIEAALM